MSGMQFDRPVGADADTKELEYVSFLHQTDVNVRTDCSIRVSRYGIEVTIETVRNIILKGLGGSDDSTEVLDLMELTAILLIPVLVKAAATIKEETEVVDIRKQFQETVKRNNSTAKQVHDSELPNDLVLPPEGLIEFLCQVILHDVTGTSATQPLTPDLLKKIFQCYGEIELSRDTDLHEQMIDCIRMKSENDVESDGKSEPIMFNTKNFATALTYDIQKYDFRNEVETITPDETLLPPQVTFGKRGKTKESVNKSTNTSETKESVYKSANTSDIVASEEAPEEYLPSPSNENDITPWNRIFTAPAIDIAAGTFRSKMLMSLLWATAILNFGDVYFQDDLAYKIPCSSSPEDYENGWQGTLPNLGCSSLSGIVKWLITFFVIGLAGMLFTSVGSIGNTVRCKYFFHPLIGCLPLAYAIYKVKTSAGSIFIYLLCVSASACVLLHIMHSIELILPSRFVANRQWLNTIIHHGLHKAERLSKQAMAKKLNIMVENSLELVKNADAESIHDSYYALALHEYSKSTNKKTERVGGIIWTWKNIWNESLFAKEGVWLSVRTTASNVAQFLVCIFVAWLGIWITRTVISGYDEDDGSTNADGSTSASSTNGNKEKIYEYTKYMIRQHVSNATVLNAVMKLSGTITEFMKKIYDLGLLKLNCTDAMYIDYAVSTACDYGEVACESLYSAAALCNLVTNESLASDVDEYMNFDVLAILNATGLSIDDIIDKTENSLLQATQTTVESLYPSELYMISVPAIVGVVVAFGAAVTLSTSYIPTLASTVLKLRCGVIPMMHNPENLKYRVAPHTVAVLTGSLFWGCLVSAALTGAVCALIVFFFLWQGTVFAAQKVIALFLGVIAITFIKFIIAVPFQRQYFASFYRRKPASANIGMLALEWANFLVTAGIIIARMASLTLVALFSVGRIYKPFLAPGVGVIGPLELDGYPTINVRELLAHEAHRHPYIELLGLVYLMKLKFADDFGKTPGSCWRLIFVHALMPWLQKYRIHSAPEMRISKQNYNSSKLGFVSIRRIKTEPTGFTTMVDDAMIEVVKNSSKLNHTDEPNCDDLNLESIENLAGYIESLNVKLAQMKDDFREAGNKCSSVSI